MEHQQVIEALAPFINAQNAKTFYNCQYPQAFVYELLAEAGVPSNWRAYVHNAFGKFHANKFWPYANAAAKAQGEEWLATCTDKELASQIKGGPMIIEAFAGTERGERAKAIHQLTINEQKRRAQA